MASPILLCDTAGMSRERWLECRAHGPKGDIKYTVGGSDVAVIFGLSPWTTPLELWRVKKGLMKPNDAGNAKQKEMGHMLEEICAYWYGVNTGNTVINDTGMYQHADHPWALANFDRRFEEPSGNRGILECKSTTFHKAMDWDDGAVPIYYEMQLRFYLSVDDTGIGDFSCMWGTNPDNDFAMPRILRDKVMEDMIFERLEQWIWSLEHDKPPTMADVAPKLALSSLARIYGASKVGLPTIEFPAKHEKSLRKILTLQEENAQLQETINKNMEVIDAHSVRIAELMKEHEHGILTTTSDKLLIDFVTRTSRRVNSDLLKKKHPTIYEDVLKESQSRKLKVTAQPV